MRIAILGCGSIGHRHLRNLQSLGYEDIAVYDIVPRPYNDIVHDALTWCETIDDVWAYRPEVALITTPSHLHIPMALEAARHGCHLFIEKPLSYTMDGIADLQHLVKKHSLMTMVGCNMRFHPGPAQVKEWLDAQRMGTVLAARIRTGSYLPHWHPQQDYQKSYSASPTWGGALLDCIHELDLALWLLGEARLASALTRPATSIGLETDGLAELLLEHHSGAISNVHLNFVQRNYRRTIEIIGSEGTIEWDFTSGRTELFGSKGDMSLYVTQSPAWEMNTMYVDEMSYFLTCVQDKILPCNPIGTATRTLELALAARRGYG